MEDKHQPGMKPVDTVGRVIVAAYLGALLAGPAPWGFPIMFDPGRLMVGKLMLVAGLIVPWAVAGLVGGRRLGLYALLAGLLFYEWHFLAWGVVLAMFVPVQLASAWFGTWLSSRWKVTRSWDGSHLWRTAGALILLLAVFTSVAGPRIALRATNDRFASIWPADSSKIVAYPAGAYVAVDGITGCRGCGFPDTYYTDPTGRSFLYKTNLD